jgi:hypothetical protein
MSHASDLLAPTLLLLLLLLLLLVWLAQSWLPASTARKPHRLIMFLHSKASDSERRWAPKLVIKTYDRTLDKPCR